MKKNDKIIRYCGPEYFRNSGIGNYSNTYIERLKKNNIILKIMK